MKEYEIKFTDDGFSIVPLLKRRLPTRSLTWPEIVNVRAFKRDIFAVDLICLFLSRADYTGLEVDENMQGWEVFGKSLPNYLPGCKTPEQWWSIVAYPAFVANTTEIFSRQVATPTKGGTP